MTTMNSSPAPGVPVGLSDLARRHPRTTRRLTAVHAWVLRALGASWAARWFGMPVLLLETTGRRSGRVRRIPLVYLPDGEDLVVVAANAGAERPPAWWLNLQATGEGVAIVGRERRPVVSAITDGPRRERLWHRFAAVSPVEHYQGQTRRRLPVVALAPLPVPARRPRGRWALGGVPGGRVAVAA